MVWTPNNGLTFIEKKNMFHLPLELLPAKKVGIGIMSGQMGREAVPEKISGDRPKFPGPSRPGGKQGVGRDGIAPEPLELWISVQISSKEGD